MAASMIALPKTLTDVNGEPTNAVYGVANMLTAVIDLVKPTHMVAALDGMKPTFRVQEFTQYKAHRAEMDPDLAVQIPKVYELLDAFGITKILAEGYEADDIIGTFATKYSGPDTQVVVVSSDRDMWQLISAHTTIMIPTSTGSAEWIGAAEVKARLGFGPEHIADYKGLRGDTSDNIPGVAGVGEKTATKLILEFGSLEDIYRNLSAVQPESLRKKLENSYEIALQSKKLATIIVDAPVAHSLEECKYSGFDKNAAFEVLKKFRFRSLAKRLGMEDRYLAEGKTVKATSSAIDQPSMF
jgi:DNA polymerase-1